MEKLMKALKFLEDPKHPCVGPHLRLLKLSGLWHHDLKSLTARVKLVLFYIVIAFFITQYIKFCRKFDFDDFKLILEYAPFHMGVVKTCFFQKDLKRWQRLVAYISSTELNQISKNDKRQDRIIHDYITKSRGITYFFTSFAFFCNFSIFSEPYQNNLIVENGTNVYVYIFDGLTPFAREPPGYYWSMAVQTVFGHLMSLYIIGWDMLTVSIMIFFAGQLRMSRFYCRTVIDLENFEASQLNIAHCHRSHINLIQYQREFNALISPVMGFYLLVITVNLGVCIIQIAEIEDDFRALLYGVSYIIACLVQLLIAYWHANEVTVESERVTYTNFESQWLGADPRLQKQVLLLGLSTTKRLEFSAGPFNTMSLSTFVMILRSSYSFYTLLKGNN